jgi:hypothetical protein
MFNGEHGTSKAVTSFLLLDWPDDSHRHQVLQHCAHTCTHKHHVAYVGAIQQLTAVCRPVAS